MLDEPGNFMVGVEVPTAAAAEGGPVVEEDRPYVVRQLLGLDRDASAPAIGAARLVREGVRIRLHAFSASNASAELANAAWRLGGAAGGGLMVPCVGRGPKNLRPDGVESEAQVRLWSWPASLPMARSAPSAAGPSCTVLDERGVAAAAGRAGWRLCS